MILQGYIKSVKSSIRFEEIIKNRLIRLEEIIKEDLDLRSNHED